VGVSTGGGPPAGPKVSLVAYNKQTGEIVWKGGARQVSYSSPNIANYGGVPQIVIVNEDQIAAHDPKTGAVLWETPWDGSSYSTASASQTIQVADDKLFVSKGYSVGGGALFSIKHNPEKAGGEGEWTITKLWNNHRVLLTKQNNVIIKDGSVYGLSDGVLQCVDLDSGKRRWAGED
jgi:outer membrane protein assembly factor BamB